MRRELLSFLIPCYRSEETVQKVVEEIITVVRQKEECYDYEIIAVNDSSPDGVLNVLQKMAEENSRIKVIDLALNRGKHSALMAGFRFASGEIVVGVDDDGQCPIDRLWDLLGPLYKGYDVAIADYQKKEESLFKRVGSRLNDWMVQTLIDKPKGIEFSNFIARKKFICDEIIKYQHSFPYLEGLTIRVTHNISMVPMEERVRVSGKSGYTLKKSVQLWVNGCTAFSVKPLRISSATGFFLGFTGFLYEMVTIIRKILNPAIAAGYSSLLAVILMVGGVIMLMLGIIGEYVGRIYLCMNNAPQYVIREMINIEDKKGGGDHA